MIAIFYDREHIFINQNIIKCTNYTFCRFAVTRYSRFNVFLLDVLKALLKTDN